MEWKTLKTEPQQQAALENESWPLRQQAYAPPQACSFNHSVLICP